MTLTRTPNFILHEYSHGFEIKSPTILASQWITGYARRFIVPTMSTQQRSPHYNKPGDVIDKYYPSFIDGVFYRFHIGCLAEFLEIMTDRGYPAGTYTHIKYGCSPATKVTFATDPSKSLRPQQQEAVDFVLKEDPTGIKSRLLQMPTGTGKTFTSLSIASKLGVKFSVHISGQYMDKWVQDVQNNTDIQEEEIYQVKGGSALIKLMHLTSDELSLYKCFIFSTETLGVYYRAYIMNQGSIADTIYPFPPEVLHGHIGVGVAIFDEIHEKLAQVYRVLSFTNVDLVIGLSGTFISIQGDILAMQKLMFPLVVRFDDIKMKKYIHAYFISYSYANFYRLNVQYRIRGSTMHNHNAYEQWILTRPKILREYLDMLGFIMHHMFKGDNDEYRTGDRSVVFVASVDLATAATEYFKKMYPELDIRRYVQDDPYENVIVPDGRVTTPLSAGAAIDIPQLTFGLMSVCVQSPIANKQVYGRLREIVGRKVTYVSLYCSQIPQQRNYNTFKKDLFRDISASMQELVMPFQLNVQK